MYELIEFETSCGGGLSVVHSNWLTPRKSEVFWSPYKELSKYNKAVKQGELVDETKWNLYKIKRCFYSSDDFEKINKKLNEAQDTSDIHSDVDNYTVRKRIIKPRRVYDTSDEDEDTERLSRPPKISKSVVSKSTENFSERNSVTRRPISTIIEPTTSYDEGQRSTPDEPVVSELRTPLSVRSSTITSVVEDSELRTPSSLRPLTITSVEFQTKILAALAHIKEQNDIIIGLLDTKVAPNKFTLPSDFPIELPIKNEDDLKLVEDYISERKNISYLVSFLAGLGGKDEVSKTNRILKQLLTDELATHYNFYGHRQKKAFTELKIESAVVEAVKSTCSTTQKEIEDCIKVYLKHAPQRLVRRLSKK